MVDTSSFLDAGAGRGLRQSEIADSANVGPVVGAQVIPYAIACCPDSK